MRFPALTSLIALEDDSNPGANFGCDIVGSLIASAPSLRSLTIRRPRLTHAHYIAALTALEELTVTVPLHRAEIFPAVYVPLACQ